MNVHVDEVKELVRPCGWVPTILAEGPSCHVDTWYGRRLPVVQELDEFDSRLAITACDPGDLDLVLPLHDAISR